MVKTNRDKFFEKYKLDKDESYSLSKVSKISGVPLSILEEAMSRGKGARKTNPSSVRNVKGKKGGPGPKMSASQWGWGRVYGLIMKNPKQVKEGAPDRDLYEKMTKKKK
jgi:hypothetical protein